MLYALVFVTRYLDLFKPSVFLEPGFLSWWNFILKIFYITSSFYIVFLMMRVYARTREREKAWRLGAYCLGGSIFLAPIIMAIAVRTENFVEWGLLGVLWTFSIILESVCVVPQLLLLRQTTVPTVIDSFYLLTLGSYRAFYILNWIVRLAGPERHFEWRAEIFGTIQTAFYVDFAWVYWTRQRVKLRNGGVVDSEDLSRGFLVSRVLGRGDPSEDEERAGLNGEDDTSAASGPRRGGNWGSRGISVSADDAVTDTPDKGKFTAHTGDSRGVVDGLAGLVDDDDSEEETSGLGKHDRGQNGHTDGQEWQYERRG